MIKKSPHNLPLEFQLKNVLETEIGIIYFYGNIIVFEANEGIVLSYKTGFSIILKVLNIIGTKSFVYISNRISSYSIKPMDYVYLNKIPNLKAVGIVNYNEAGHLNSELEAKFCEKPFMEFYNLQEAVIWAKPYL